MEPVLVRSDRLVLSVPVAADIDRVAEYCADPEIGRFLPLPRPYTRAHAEAFALEIVPAGWADDTAYEWAVREEEDGPLLGMIGWRKSGYIGFWMGAPHRGRGYMTEAAAIVCEWVFGTFDEIGEIAWEAMAGNIASAHVAHRAGFAFAGEAPLAHPDRDGSHPDGWHAVLGRDDDRDLKDGWPL